MNGEKDQSIPKQDLTRRDFLKLSATAVVPAIFLADLKGIKDTLYEAYPKASFVEFEADKFLPQLKEVLGVEEEEFSRFAIQTGDLTTNFVTLPPKTEIKDGEQYNVDERLFVLQEKPNPHTPSRRYQWIELKKEIITPGEDNLSIINWTLEAEIYNPRPKKEGPNSRFIKESILSYPALKEEEWLAPKLDKNGDDVRGMAVRPSSFSSPFVRMFDLFKKGWDRDTDVPFFIPLAPELPDSNQHFQIFNASLKRARLEQEEPGVDDLEIRDNLTINIDEEYMGVNIHGRFLVDESNTEIGSVKLPEKIGAEVIARIFFDTWLRKGPSPVAKVPEGEEYESKFAEFMDLWSRAQKTNNQGLWKQLEIKIWANDKSTKGYKQEEVVILPMYPESLKTKKEGITKYGITSFDFVEVRTSGVENITRVDDHNIGFGTNITSDNSLQIYIGCAIGNPSSGYTRAYAEVIAIVPWWLRKNDGRTEYNETLSYSLMNRTIKDHLINGGFSIRK